MAQGQARAIGAGEGSIGLINCGSADDYNQEFRRMSSDLNQISRRALVANMGYGIAAAALTNSTAVAQSPDSTTAPMANPKSKYPKPPYPDQSQPWPGLASKMNPRPDHGESSYKGSGRLKGRK